MPSVSQLIALGFDKSERLKPTRSIRVKCSQCLALVVNGTATHETGCPNQKSECNGCDAIVDKGVRYCEDCQ